MKNLKLFKFDLRKLKFADFTKFKFYQKPYCLLTILPLSYRKSWVLRIVYMWIECEIFENLLKKKKRNFPLLSISANIFFANVKTFRFCERTLMLHCSSSAPLSFYSCTLYVCVCCYVIPYLYMVH